VASRIDDFQSGGATSVVSNRTTAPSSRESSGATTSNSQSGGDNEVQITSTASQLASLGQKLSALPAVDANRVARISQSLAAGTYSICADKIAGALLQSDHALAQIGMQES
jgi:negative regulator of flagellin synthesis FlgM